MNGAPESCGSSAMPATLPEQSEAGSLRDRGGARALAELVADVRDVPVHRVRADDELLGDLAVAEAACHESEHLELAGGEVVVSARARRRGGLVADEERARGADHRRGVASPR